MVYMCFLSHETFRKTEVKIKKNKEEDIKRNFDDLGLLSCKIGGLMRGRLKPDRWK